MFSVWNIAFLLVVSLSLGNTAPATTPPQDCETIVTPLTMDNYAKISGRWNFIEGFSDHDHFNSILKITHASWIDITASPEDNSTLVLTQHNRINGTCSSSQAKMTAISDITIDVAHEGAAAHRLSLLSTCVNCLVFNFTTSVREVDVPIQSLYIFGRGPSMKESDLEVFHQQAKCLNFSLPASFHYNQEQEFCSEHNMTAAVKKEENNM